MQESPELCAPRLVECPREVGAENECVFCIFNARQGGPAAVRAPDIGCDKHW